LDGFKPIKDWYILDDHCNRSAKTMIFWDKLLLGALSVLSLSALDCQTVKDENKLFFDFSNHSSNGWSGIEGWQWTPNNKRPLMALKGLPDSGGK